MPTAGSSWNSRSTSRVAAAADGASVSGVILAFNVGSSGVKFAGFELQPAGLAERVRGTLTGIGGRARLRATAEGREVAGEPLPGKAGADHRGALAHALAWLRGPLGDAPVAAVAHRIVHGGEACAGPVRVDDAVLAALERLVPLAPLHQPQGIAGIRAVAAELPDAVQVACFDTAFHRTQPPLARTYALPKRIRDEGVRGYGFHGLSCEYVARRLDALSPGAAAGRAIIAHLGNGASLTAIREGRSVATTMGFSALDGVPMGTRCGALDPGVVLYLLRAGLDADALEELLYRDSGLKALSGGTGDMRELEASDEPRARFAVEYFAYRCAREIGSLAAALGGLDALVFTAGIGENSAGIRARICTACAWLGVAADARANAAGAARFDATDSRVSLWRIPTDEERVMAEHAARLAGGG